MWVRFVHLKTIPHVHVYLSLVYHQWGRVSRGEHQILKKRGNLIMGIRFKLNINMLLAWSSINNLNMVKISERILSSIMYQ